MKRYHAITAITAVVLALFTSVLPVPVLAQSGGNEPGAVVISRNYGAISQDVAMLITHIGTAEACGKLGVTAAPAITFAVGACGSEAADSTVTCPSGGTAGTIDTTNAACDTLGEVVDVINASAKWKAVIVDGLRTDSSNATLTTFAATNTGGVNDATVGKQVLFLTTATSDSATLKFNSISLQQAEGLKMSRYLVGQGGQTKLNPNPFRGWRNKLLLWTNTPTYTGAGTLTVYSVLAKNDPSTGKGSETVTVLYSKAAAASTNANTLDFTSGYGGLLARDGEKLIVRMQAATTLTVITQSAFGVAYPLHP